MRSVTQAAAYLINNGEERISVAELDRRLKALGYKRNMSTACVGPVYCLNTGVVYTGINYNVVEIDTGMSFAHYQARRDARFKELQEMRQRVFCVVNGRILSV
jgi:hypothetical protein